MMGGNLFIPYYGLLLCYLSFVFGNDTCKKDNAVFMDVFRKSNCTFDEQALAGRTLLHHVDVPTKKARFGMGCFWGADSLFGSTLGVIRTRVGYSGGTSINPSYRNLEDHTEAVDIDYDPQVIDYQKILQLFWMNHNPTENRKKQYSSIIFYYDEDQKAEAEESLKNAQKNYSDPIATRIIPAGEFYDAEDFHQKYRLQQDHCLTDVIGMNISILKTSTLAARLNGYINGRGGSEQFEKEVHILGIDGPVADYVRRLIQPKGVC